MAISASGQGGVPVRVDLADSGALIATANAAMAVMGGRTMQGWLLSVTDWPAFRLRGRGLFSPANAAALARETFFGWCSGRW